MYIKFSLRDGDFTIVEVLFLLLSFIQSLAFLYQANIDSVYNTDTVLIQSFLHFFVEADTSMVKSYDIVGIMDDTNFKKMNK